MQTQSFVAKTNFGRLGIAMLVIGSLALTSCQDAIQPHPTVKTQTLADDSSPDAPEAKPPIGGHGGGSSPDGGE